MQLSEHKIENYLSLNDCEARIKTAKATLGSRLVILGHHYQQEAVFKHADFSGDSLKLSREAAQSAAEYIVFCGVHFMAEVADMLSRPEQKVILPDLSAGCSMADMANLAHVQQSWHELSQILGTEEHIIPVTYINSAANLKAFCGQQGGIVCTSSNARQVLQWSFTKANKVLFFPDQHLGRNTGHQMGIPLEQMVVWDFEQPQGGLTTAQIKAARIILWKGFCGVHQVFLPKQIDDFLAQYPETKVIAHPEAAFEVCQKADAVGSTEFIIKTIQASAAGTRWLVGTELNLVERLARQFAADGKMIHFMSPITCFCSTMYRIDPQHLLWVLENLVKGVVVNQITVSPAEAELARLALARMFAVSS